MIDKLKWEILWYFWIWPRGRYFALLRKLGAMAPLPPFTELVRGTLSSRPNELAENVFETNALFQRIRNE